MAAVLLLVLSSNDKVIPAYGVNRTLGWWWHAGNILPFAAYTFIFMAFICSYLALYTYDVRLHKTFTVLHAVFFIALLPFYIMTRINGEALLYVVFGCLLLSFIFFIVNIILSLTKYRRQKRNIAYKK